MSTFLWLLIFGAAFGAAYVAYWAPTIVAHRRHADVRRMRSVALVNGLLGFTVWGWLLAMEMAGRTSTPAPRG